MMGWNGFRGICSQPLSLVTDSNCSTTQAISTGAEAREFFEKTFPMFSPALRQSDLDR